LSSDSSTITSSTSPTVAYLTATSTTATSTFAGGLNVAGSSVLTVLQNGNVGIGIINPNNKLQVLDLIDFNNTDFNTKIGYQAGKNIVVGARNNTFLGYNPVYLARRLVRTPQIVTQESVIKLFIAIQSAVIIQQ
jgi:hypothetical protein